MTSPYIDKCILITGGTGSFGTTMLSHLDGKGCGEIRIFSRDESKQDDLRKRFRHQENVRFYIGDVRDSQSVEGAMVGVDLVFHAAALKQVPSCEFFPLEAVATNVIGSANVIRSAINQQADKVVVLSTDKAIYPINAMGMTKALMEKVMQATARDLNQTRSKTIVCGVRYGNVMYSRGSVLPLFVEQLKSHRVLTVTEPSMTRFLLPLQEAIELVEFAFMNARNGDVFIRKAPSATMADTAEAVQNVFRRNVGVVRIGIRHGEKLFETLATKHELRLADDLGDWFRVPMDDRDLSYSAYFTEGDTEEILLEDYHSHNAERLTVQDIENLLRSLPEIQAELKAI